MTQLLAGLDLFFVVLIRAPMLGEAMWWLALISTCVVLALVCVLAVR